jgi:hypothetical protein
VTPLARFAKRALERLFGTWEEGVEPPARLREMVLLFAEHHPMATRGEWLEFAAGHAAESYRTGYLRGLEASLRDEEAKPWREASPEALADALDPGWRDSPPAHLPAASEESWTKK